MLLYSLFYINKNAIAPYSCIDTNISFKNLILVGNKVNFILFLRLVYGFKNNSLSNYLLQKIFYYKYESFFLVGLHY